MLREHFSKRTNWKCGEEVEIHSFLVPSEKKKPRRIQISSSPKTNTSTNISGDPMIGGSRLPNVSFCCHVTINSQNTKLNARLALRQRADLLVANISTNRISLPQGQSYTEGKYNNGSLN